ncbi:MAG: LAGLIDADG family homing endonuclease, partial [Candidatus Hydrothermarchaeales archaeon]
MISEIRSDHVGKLLSIEGIVRKATDVRPKLVMAAFECKRCGNIIRVEQVENVIKEPFLCEGCDTRGPFKLLPDESKFVDSQKMLMQESLESLRGGEHPKQIRVTLEDDLSGEITPGDRIGVVGILRAVRKRFREKGSRVFDIFIEANSLQPIELEFEEVKISKKDEKKLLKMSKDPLIYDKIRDSIAPHIYGYNTIKEAVMYQLFTSPPIELPDGGRIRGDSHVLILGEPSTGKSEILQHVARELAPRGIYSSGKGTTGAGLCVAPDSLVCLSTGELKPIKELVERELKDNIKKYREGIWIARRPSLEYNAVSLNGGHKSEEKSISQFWRLKSPKKLIRLTTRSGKRITTTATTPFPVIHGGEIIWKEAAELSRGDYVATPRRLVTSKNRNPPLIELVESDPIVYGCENLVKEIVEILTEKYNTSIRGLAKQLDISENNLYFSWVKEGVRGAPRLSDVILLAEKAGVSLEEVVNHMEYYSQYHGHKIKLPKRLNEDFLYFAGLIAGDGDISRTSYGGYSIRFSNSSLELLDRYSSLIYELFGVNFDKSESSEKRPPSIRFHSKIVGEILEKLGIPVSPKSHKVDMSNILLSLPDNLLASFIRGLFDCDGGVVNQDGAGSSYIEFNTTGKKLAKKLHITLLRYEIISMLRKRMVRGRTEVIRTEDGERAIRSLHDRYCITIYGKENLVKFKHCIGFSHPDKKDKLNRVIDNISNAHTNIDTIPYIGKVMKDVRRSFAIPSRLIYGYKNYEYENGRRNPSRSFLQKFVRRVKRNMGGHEERVYVKIEDETKKKLYSTSLEYLAKDELMTLLDIKEHGLYDYFSRKNRTQGIPLAKLKILCDFLEEEGHKELSFKEVGRHTVPRLLDIKTGIKKAEEDLRKLEMLASSDILWDRVTKTEMVENGQAYVYDLTVDGAHNFLVDGIFSHNTATAVKDEFGDGGWSLEAGALVLADKGIACLHPNSKVLVDNRIADIESLFDENNKYFALTGGEETEISDLNAEVVSLNELKSVSKKSTLIRRKKYRGKMLEVTTKSGFKVRLTPDHKLLDGNSLKWKEAKDFRVSDFIVSPLKLPENDEELYLLDLIPDEWLVILDSKEKKEIKEKVLSKYKTLKEFNEKYGLNKDVLSGKNQTTVGTFKAILREFNCYDEWKKRNLSYGRKSAGERLKISKITPELAYFLGFLYGDGHISTNERRSSVSITQSTKNSEQIEQLKRTFENFSNRKLHSYERLSKSKIRGKDTESYNVILYPNSNLIAYLYNYFTKNNLENILRLPDEALKAFIAGALDSDGCISIKRGRKSNKFYETVHVEFLLSKEDEKNKAFMLALRRLDCFGRLIKGINIDRIRITGRTDVHKLVEGIKKYSTKVKDLPPRKHIVSSLSEKVPLDVAAHICSELSDINKSILLKRGVWSTIYNYKNKT